MGPPHELLAVDAALTIPNDAASIADCRHWLADVLRARSAPAEVIDDLVLAVSEIVTNVVEYSDAIEVLVLVRDHVVDVEVAVSGADALEFPVPAPATPLATSGRGLAIVGRLVDDVRLEVADDAVFLVVRMRLVPPTDQ